ncbi:MAG: hypothetical protein ACPGVA_14900 [Pikeienuella sp.]
MSIFFAIDSFAARAFALEKAALTVLMGRDTPETRPPHTPVRAA